MRMTYEDVRKVAKNPRVHGNGFLQLDLPDNKRMHIWGHPDIPSQDVPTTIHDHRFGFTSVVAMGSIVNTTYLLEPLAGEHDYDIYTPILRVGEDTLLYKTQYSGKLIKVGARLVRVGEAYEMEPGVLHSTEVDETTVTIMTKTSQMDMVPRVLCPIGSSPDNDFTRYSMSEKAMWRVVADLFD